MSTAQDQILDFYRQPGRMTDLGACASAFDSVPARMPEIAAILHGMLIHEHIAGRYGVTLTDDRRDEVHTRSAEERLQRALHRDGRPVDAARAPVERSTSNCRHFSVLAVALLRRGGVPARARCGFGAYFEPDLYVDHWVCEYWDSGTRRWILADAQIDGLQKALFRPDFDLMDVPRDRFVVAGEAWRMCRSGEADPQRFGILDMHGDWFVSGNLVRDIAALNNMEMLPWDVWGPMIQPGQHADAARLALHDRLAEYSRAPDANFTALRDAYERGPGLRVPDMVYNAVRDQPERV
ncbi:MAG: transglutaminase domain-containing protein [Chloroflexi bacterium]|nr:transglutaminase domain-containing protein [Chloroflexota bacterium]